jgi:hypothetical protein
VRPATSTPPRLAARWRLGRRTTWILPGPRQYTDASELTSSRLPTIHLSKSYVTKVLRHRPLRVRDVQLFSPPGSSQRSLPRSREAESYRSFRPCQSASGRNFLQPFPATDRPAANPQPTPRNRLSPGPIRPLVSRAAVQSYADANRQVRHVARTFQKVLREATGDPGTTNAAVQSTAADFRVVGRSENPTNSAGGEYTSPRRTVKPPESFPFPPGSPAVNVALTSALRRPSEAVHLVAARNRKATRPVPNDWSSGL